MVVVDVVVVVVVVAVVVVEVVVDDVVVVAEVVRITDCVAMVVNGRTCVLPSTKLPEKSGNISLEPLFLGNFWAKCSKN